MAKAPDSVSVLDPGLTAVLDLTWAAVCLDCQILFDLRSRSCPRCSGLTWMPLSRWLARLSDAPAADHSRAH